jgi:hypothetical protein
VRGREPDIAVLRKYHEIQQRVFAGVLDICPARGDLADDLRIAASRHGHLPAAIEAQHNAPRIEAET